jgi:hypothetical protein
MFFYLVSAYHDLCGSVQYRRNLPFVRNRLVIYIRYLLGPLPLRDFIEKLVTLAYEIEST